MYSRLLVFVLILYTVACQPLKHASIQDQTLTSTLPPGAPKLSDVCFSSRWERPRDTQDTLESFSAARNFHATYLNWVYTTNPVFIRKADSLGYKLQVALTPTLPDLPFGNDKREKGRIVNKAGEPVTAPWMKGWDNWWGCVNHPEFQKIYFENIKAALDAGAFGFQVDDPAMGYLLLRNQWEDLCYCEYCYHKADSLHLTPSEIQESSVIEFHQNMKIKAEKYAGRPVPFSCNNFEGDWDLFPFNFFDFGVAEIPERRWNPQYLYSAIREARRRGKAQVLSFANEREWLVQKMIAATYAAGGNLLVPWDIWMGGNTRYFGKPGQYAPFYGFVRANAAWLDGYEDAFYTSTQADVRFIKPEKMPVSFDEYKRQVHAFVRARPGDKESPVVIHLVDWHVLMDTFSIRLNEKRFFKKGIASIELLTPIAFNQALHENAALSGDFSSLVQNTTLSFSKKGKLIRLEIPKLDLHWGILLINGRK